jgi:hypothetical protein
MTKHIMQLCIIGVILTGFVSAASAEDDWNFMIAPYMLLPTISGDASVGIVEGAEIDVGPDDILNNLEIGGMIQAEAYHVSGFGLSLSYNFMDLGSEASDPAGGELYDADIFQGILEGYGMYRYRLKTSTVKNWSTDVSKIAREKAFLELTQNENLSFSHAQAVAPLIENHEDKRDYRELSCG